MRRRPVVAELMIVLVDKYTGVNQRAAISGTKSETNLVNVGKNVDLPNGLGFSGTMGILIEEGGEQALPWQIFGGALDSDKGPDDRRLGRWRPGNMHDR